MKIPRLLLTLCFLPSAHAAPLILCDISKGLELINQENYPVAQVEKILADCDKVSPSTPAVLLLHGLEAQKKALQTKDYSQALGWFEKAHRLVPKNSAITMALAGAYEQANSLSMAMQVYQTILLTQPENREALLGQARILRIQGQMTQATAIYSQLLIKHADDVNALNGLAWIKASEKDLTAANYYFQAALKILPENQEALIGLEKIRQTMQQSLAGNSLCDVANGLILLNQVSPPLEKIKDILQQCAKNKITNADTLMLEGLLVRKLAFDSNKNYKAAIAWLEKAVQSAQASNKAPILELATTYEWAAEPKKAEAIYQQLLAQDKTSRVALLGLARTYRMLSQWQEASLIYHQFLAKNPKDLEALIGLGWIELAKSNFEAASQLFIKSLGIDSTNKEAKLALNKVEEAKQHRVPELTVAEQGLMLLNEKNPPIDKIQSLLSKADRLEPNTAATLMLHGLLARHFKAYPAAIQWLSQAANVAKSGDVTPLTELAVTYEWASQFQQALFVYQEILRKKPNDHTALLGKARVFRSLYQIPESKALYRQILESSPKDVAGLTGYGETLMTNYELEQAREVFNSALALKPADTDILKDLSLLDKTTKNILSVTGGHYAVPPKNSEGMNVYYFRNLNATDGLSLLATHNTKQIESGFGIGPTLLPNSSLLMGYQRILPKKYNWQLSYDARQHNGLPFENRAFGLAGLFLRSNLEWFNGVRIIAPRPWNTRLYISGLTVYTPLPADVTLTGFWTEQQIGGYTSSYVIDLKKEFSNRFFYDLGASYLPQQQGSWEVHGKLILPIFKNQALVSEYSHYFFNNSTYFIAGWRVYWA